MSIPFTQYLRPDGRKRDIAIDRTDDIEGMAETFIQSGGRYEAEELRNGMVSLTAVHRLRGWDDTRDVCLELCMNDATIPAHVDKLVVRSIGWLHSHAAQL